MLGGAMKKTIGEIQEEMNAMEYELEKLRKLQYYEWPLEDRMRYGRLQAMKQRRMDDWIRQTNKDIREEKV
jgi:Sec-independent protein translocase protein TatA